MTIDELINISLTEDVGDGDHTSLACVPIEEKGKAKLLVKENGIIAGVDIALKVFKQVDTNLKVDILIPDGSAIKKGDIVFFVEGSSQSILTAERLALNFMQRMSGIATHTNELAQIIKDLPCKLLDTRKTTPGLREIEKMAVKIGGGYNHRFGLYDMVMIKDNHIDYAGGIKAAIEKVNNYLKNNHKSLKIEIEARNLQEVSEILVVGNVDRIMLDNFSYSDLRKAVDLIGDSAETEASGGITKETLYEFANCGVDFISVGALTHQINSLDLSLKAV